MNPLTQTYYSIRNARKGHGCASERDLDKYTPKQRDPQSFSEFHHNLHPGVGHNDCEYSGQV
jgi:hypothetical protein